eukprot:TRINITY_DN1940_c0_g1_i2.p1 TRINITY_DN1940_c0_g1~~TRINITY_DN1940_c0_g1_i2.p1  ORF type:complete len:617 (+),score=127.83 TRINITY_DN1940_c0_g1_i2:141-1991(+)
MDQSIAFDEQELECPICYEIMTGEIIIASSSTDAAGKCNHSMCKECWEELKRKHGDTPNCPTCRRVITSVVPNSLAMEVVRGVYQYKNTIEEKLQQRKQAIARLQQQIDQEKESCKAAVDASTKASEEQQNRIKGEYESRIREMQELLLQLQSQLEEKVAYQRELENAKKREKELEEQLRTLQLQAQYKNEELEQRLARARAEKDELAKVARRSPPIAEAAAHGSASVIGLDNSIIAGSVHSYTEKIRSLFNSYVFASSTPAVVVEGGLVLKFSDFKLIERRGNSLRSPVWKAKDETKDKIRALKMIHYALEEDQQETILVESFREPFLLSKIEHPNVIQMLGLLPGSANGREKYFYMIMPFVECDLDYLIRTKIQFNQPKIIYQLLSAITYLHSLQVVHRDISATSILCDPASSNIQLVSFSSARSLFNLPLRELPTLNYHWAPELLIQRHDDIENWKAVDLWAVGCLFAQLVLRQEDPFFARFARGPLMKGPNNLLCEIFCLKDCWPEETSTSGLDTYLRTFKSTKPETLQNLFNSPKITQAQQLLEKMLRFDPTQRITASEALNDPLFAKFRSNAHVSMRIERELADDKIQAFVMASARGLAPTPSTPNVPNT